MPDAESLFFRVKLGAIKVGDALSAAWLYNPPGRPEALQITTLHGAAVVMPLEAAARTIGMLRPLFEHAELEPATFAEWIDQGGTPLEKLTP